MRETQIKDAVKQALQGVSDSWLSAAAMEALLRPEAVAEHSTWSAKSDADYCEMYPALPLTPMGSVLSGHEHRQLRPNVPGATSNTKSTAF